MSEPFFSEYQVMENERPVSEQNEKEARSPTEAIGGTLKARKALLCPPKPKSVVNNTETKQPKTTSLINNDRKKSNLSKQLSMTDKIPKHLLPVNPHSISRSYSLQPQPIANQNVIRLNNEALENIHRKIRSCCFYFDNVPPESITVPDLILKLRFCNAIVLPNLQTFITHVITVNANPDADYVEFVTKKLNARLCTSTDILIYRAHIE